MKKSRRALVGMVVLDLLILLGAGWMVLQTRSGVWRSSDPEKATSLITSSAGGAIGVISAILLIAFFAHRSRGD